MAWNEPGNKNPWGDGGNNQSPPDLDEVLRKLQKRMSGLFGGGSGKGSGSSPAIMGWLFPVIAVVWLLSGIYIVDEGKRGVILRFGEFIESTMPGPHWRVPYPVETVKLVDVEQRRFVEVGYRSSGGRNQSTVTVARESLMLTNDENIVSVQMAVQYQVKNARDYLFNVRNPDDTLKQATESALREVIGKSNMDFVLTEGRSEVAARVKQLIQDILDQYNTGLLVTTANLLDAQPPEEVQAAFADAIKAREDEQRLKNEAETYSNGVIPKARGMAARQMEEANAYKERVIAQAEGETSRFIKMYDEYKKAPEVTRKRLYLDTMESVLTRSTKVTVDMSNNNSLMYLPLDKLFSGGSTRTLTPQNIQSKATRLLNSRGGKMSERVDQRRGDGRQVRESR
ncbi:MAG: FtsH protease activity modulator HflK [Gammaproteobacteria bacterium]|nr:FtsH protease activity modulator HflK [Gammaproteobacteria bacterium]